MKLSIIIVTCNNIEYLKLCTNSILKYTKTYMSDYEIIIIDNGNTNEIKENMELSNLNVKAKFIFNKENLGFTKACNQGIKVATGEYVIFLNDDTIVSENWDELLMNPFSQIPDIGFTGPVSNSVFGVQQVTCAYVQDFEYLKKTEFKDFENYIKTHKLQNKDKFINSFRLVGFCLCTKKEILDKIGEFDERFDSGGFDDDDICLRAIFAGYHNIVIQECFIHHFGSMTYQHMNINRQALLYNNYMKFINKWYPKVLPQRQYYVNNGVQ